MSTDFTLYALAPEHEREAVEAMRTSLGYGGNIIDVINANAREQRRPDWWNKPSLSELAPTFVVDGDHTGEDDLCSELRDLIGPDLPVLDAKLAAAIIALVPVTWTSGYEWPLEPDGPAHLATSRWVDRVPPKGNAWDKPLGTWTNIEGRVIPQVRALNPRVWRAGLLGFLTGAQGRKLWWQFV